MEKDNRTSQELLKEFMESDTFKQQEKLIAERKKTLKSGDNVVHLEYLGVFQDEDIQKLDEILENAKLDLSSYNSSGVMQNSFDNYTFIAFLAINQPLIIELLKGLGTNAIWDVIKETVFFVRNKIKGEKINKITSTTVEEKDITFGLKVNLDKNTSFDFELKGNVSDEVIGESLDKVLSFLKDKKLNASYQHPDFLKYSEKENKWIKVDVMEEIRKTRKKKK